MFDNNSFSRTLGQRLTFFVILGSILWMVLLVIATANIRNTNRSSYEVKFGPVLLDKITREPTKHGYAATISMETGLFVYYLIWLSIGAAASVIISYSRTKKS